MHITLSAILGIALSFTAHATTLDTNEAFFIGLNKKGLKLVAQEIREEELKPIEKEPLPDLNEKASGVDIHASGLSYSAQFGELELNPSSGILSVNLDIEKMNLYIPKATFKKKIVFTISSTCKNTMIEVNRVKAHVDLTSQIKEGFVRLSAPTVSLPIGEDNYVVHGPEKCSGVPGFRDLVKWAVKKVLQKGREKVEGELTKRIKEMVPKLEERFNDATRRQMRVALEDLLPIPNHRALLSTAPHYIGLDDSGVSFVLSVDVAGDSLDSTQSLVLDETGLGQAGVNPVLFTEIFEKIVPQEEFWVELSEEMVPNLNDLLTVQNLSGIWPDLNDLALSKSHLKAIFRLASAPRFEMVDKENELRLLMPLIFRFKIHQEGSWRYYFEMKMDVDVGVKVKTDGEMVDFYVGKDAAVTASGDWFESFRPKEPLFEAEVAEVVFSGLFDALYAKGPIASIDVPKTEFGGKEVTLTRPHVKTPFVQVDLVSKK